MRNAWYYWLWFGIGVAVVAAALGWLTREALELDRAESTARQQAELEESVGRALWRMDVRLMPLLAREAARPYFLYESFYTPPDAPKSLPPFLCPSPLLLERPEFVVIHFQLSLPNQWRSAQVPTKQELPLLTACNVSPNAVREGESLLAELQNSIRFDDLCEALPVEKLTAVWNSPAAKAQIPPAPNSKFVSNSSVDENLAKPQSAVQQTNRVQRSQSRNSNELANRDANFQNLAQQEFEGQRAIYKASAATGVSEGISRPLWVGERLLLARRVERDGEIVIQGCWLDWPKIKQTLQAEVADLFPNVDLEPVIDNATSQVNRMLATLPAQLVVPAVVAANDWSPIRTSLVIAWSCFLLIATTSLLFFRGLLSLSERRAAFVSAVTHELRTPLTTFRLYSEMLAQDMVPDAVKRQQYLNTLRVEADRLGHLVENVLSYAKLERGRPSRLRERTTVDRLLDRCRDRLSERAAQAEMSVVISFNADQADLVLETDPEAVEQILFNLVDNACKYAARAEVRRIEISAERVGQRIALRVADRGPGIAPSVARRLFQPFSKSAEDAAHSAPGVGLGLALCRRMAHELGGRLTLAASSSQGATFLLSLPACDPV